jgi:hypothetical protein
MLVSMSIQYRGTTINARIIARVMSERAETSFFTQFISYGGRWAATITNQTDSIGSEYCRQNADVRKMNILNYNLK